MKNNYIFKDGIVVMLAHVMMVKESKYLTQEKCFEVMFTGTWSYRFPLEEKDAFLTSLFAYRAK